LDLHEGPDAAVVTDLAAVEIHEAMQDHVRPQAHIRR
jgi:hypothetical protein